MLTFRRFTLIFLIILPGLNLWILLAARGTGGFPLCQALVLNGLLVAGYLGISFAMAFLPCSNFHHPVICRGRTGEKSVSITFDDGPDPVKTPVILEVLKKHGARATFFCIGGNLAGNETLLKKMIAEGHLPGNHSFSHSRWFDLFSADKIRAELLETDRMISEITGKTPCFFRPPFGVVNPMVSRALKNMHWQAVCWDIRSFDTMNPDPQKIKHKILRRLQPGSIILLHDATTFTAHHLDELLSAIADAGYKVVPLDSLLKLPAYAG
ncbi:MAG: polysaccharide deacetylase family protein [Bacteroidetes bacterium]|nr:polysaccharide deacetylase family protein [Bacteroidota bacterium]